MVAFLNNDGKGTFYLFKDFDVIGMKICILGACRIVNTEEQSALWSSHGVRYHSPVIPY